MVVIRRFKLFFGTCLTADVNVHYWCSLQKNLIRVSTDSIDEEIAFKPYCIPCVFNSGAFFVFVNCQPFISAAATTPSL